MKLPVNRGGLRFYLTLIALLWGAATTASIAAGCPTLVLGVLLHVWAKGCLRQNRVVAMGGPYRFVRHPFYLANALIDASIAVMSNWWLLQIALPIWWLAVYIPVIRGEERFLLESFPNYADYRCKVPCLIPWRRPWPARGEGFSWRNPNIVSGQELPRALRALAYPLLLYVGLLLRRDRWSFSTSGLDLAILTSFLALHLVAVLLRRYQAARWTK